MNNTATTLEQSIHLIESGLNPNTSDMYWDTTLETPMLFYNSYQNKADYDNMIKNGLIPAWSLSVLMNLLPSEFYIKGKLGTFTYKIDIRKYKFIENVNVYQIAYGNYGISGDWHDRISTPECENPIEAVYTMVEWLVKNKRI